MRAAFGLLGLILLAAGSVGAAPPAEGRQASGRKVAERYFDAGQQAYEKGDYLTAIRSFEESYRAVAHPATLFALAQSYRQQYKLDQDLRTVQRAIDLYQRFLKAAPKSAFRSDAEAELLQLLAIVARLPRDTPPPPARAAPPPTQLMITSPTPGARVQIDGEPRNGEPAPAIRVVSPGRHRVMVQAPGYTAAERTVAAAKGRLMVHNVELTAKPGELQVMANRSGAAVYVDGQAVGKTPLRGAAVSAGPHRITVTARGHRPWFVLKDIASDRPTLVFTELRTSRQRKLTYGVLGGSGALGLAGVIAGLLALKADSDLEGMAVFGDPERARYNAQLADRDGLATASTILFAAAGGALLAAAALYWFDLPEPPPHAPPPSPAAALHFEF